MFYFPRVRSIRRSEIFPIFEKIVAYTTFRFLLKPGGSVYVPKDHIRLIASPFSFHLSAGKLMIEISRCMAMAVCGVPPFCTMTSKILIGY